MNFAICYINVVILLLRLFVVGLVKPECIFNSRVDIEARSRSPRSCRTNRLDVSVTACVDSLRVEAFYLKSSVFDIEFLNEFLEKIIVFTHKFLGLLLCKYAVLVNLRCFEVRKY